MIPDDAAPDLQAIARRLRQAELDGVATEPVRDELPAGDIDTAYAVQAINTEDSLARGRRMVGRKIGLTSRPVQAQLGVDQPDFGTLFADMCFADAEPVPLGRVLQPRIEAEIALVLGADVTTDQPTLVDLLRAVDHALPAMEIVGSRVAGWDITITDTVADNASAGLFVLGTRPVGPADFDHRLCGMVMEVDGEEASLGSGAACLGNPLTAALWLVRRLRGAGESVRAGEVILTGALGPMVEIRPGQVVEARIDGVGSVRADLSEES